MKNPTLLMFKVVPNTLKNEARMYIGISRFIVLFLPMVSGKVKNKSPEAKPKKYMEQNRSMLY